MTFREETPWYTRCCLRGGCLFVAICCGAWAGELSVRAEQGSLPGEDHEVERAAREYRLSIYDRFSKTREEYDHRRTAGERVLRGWRDAGQPADQRDALIQWFQDAVQSSQSPDNLSLPMLPDFAAPEEDFSEGTSGGLELRPATATLPRETIVPPKESVLPPADMPELDMDMHVPAPPVPDFLDLSRLTGPPGHDLTAEERAAALDLAHRARAMSELATLGGPFTQVPLLVWELLASGQQSEPAEMPADAGPPAPALPRP